MGKVRISTTELKKNYFTVRTGYAELQHILKYEAELYNAGSNGWNYDIYTEPLGGNIAITTGYRGTNGPTIPEDLIKRFNERAEQIDKMYYAIQERERRNMIFDFWQAVRNFWLDTIKH